MAIAGQMKRAITGFRQDEEANWVAELECGHTRHVRHNPPWIERPWVLTEVGRQGFIGRVIECKKCDEEQGIATEITVVPDL